MNEVVFFSAFSMGLLGNLHCLGMCGPIVVVLHGNRPLSSRLSYQAGRISMYSAIGLLIGLSGGAFRLATSQEIISIIAGSLMLFMLAIPSKTMAALPIIGALGKVFMKLQQKTSIFWKERSLKGDFALGAINGILPCGFLYAAFLGSLNAEYPIGSALWMTLFGIGTIPSMLFAGSMASIKHEGWNKLFKKLLPIGTACIAILFILRGLALGIPMISPKLPQQIQSSNNKVPITQQEDQCCAPKH